MVNAAAFTLLCGAIAVSLVVFNPQKSVYDIGLYLLHMGIVVFVVGMMIFALKGTSHYLTLSDLLSVTEDVKIILKAFTVGAMCSTKQQKLHMCA